MCDVPAFGVPFVCGAAYGVNRAMITNVLGPERVSLGIDGVSAAAGIALSSPLAFASEVIL